MSSPSRSAAVIASAVSDVLAFLTVPSTHGLDAAACRCGTAIHSTLRTVLLSDQRSERSSTRPTNVARHAPGHASTSAAPPSMHAGVARIAGSMPERWSSSGVPSTLTSDDATPAKA